MRKLAPLPAMVAISPYAGRASPLDSLRAAYGQTVHAGASPLGAPLRGEYSSATAALVLHGAASAAPAMNAVQAALKLPHLMMQTVAAPTHQLFLITSGAHTPIPIAVAPGLSGAAHGSVWGFARVLRLEQPAWRVLCADVTAGCRTSLAHALVSQDGNSDSTELVWHGADRHVRRLQRGKASPRVPVVFHAAGRGSFVVTGGLGGLGLRMADFLFNGSVGSICLASRSGRVARGDAGSSALLDRLLTERGSLLHLMRCDVSELPEVATLRAAAHRAGLPLRGLMHMTEVLSDKLLRSMTASTVSHSPLSSPGKQ